MRLVSTSADTLFLFTLALLVGSFYGSSSKIAIHFANRIPEITRVRIPSGFSLVPRIVGSNPTPPPPFLGSESFPLIGLMTAGFQLVH
jgi:hypothetical protein